MLQAIVNDGRDPRSIEAILMARFLDRDARPLEPRMVLAIVYSIFEIDPLRQDVRSYAADHDYVALMWAK